MLQTVPMTPMTPLPTGHARCLTGKQDLAAQAVILAVLGDVVAPSRPAVHPASACQAVP